MACPPDLALGHALKIYKDAKKPSHVGEDARGINAENLVITDHPRIMGNACQFGI